MNKEQKAAKIEEIAAQIEGAAAIFAIDYRGISVPQAAELRGKLREIDASFWVVKNRLTKLAAEKAGEGRLTEWLEGPTALTFARGDTAMAAKAIATFNREHEVLTFKGGFMDGLSLDEEKFKSIARLPSREVLDGQLAGIVASPLTSLVRGLGSMIQGLALQLGQIAEKGLVSGDAPTADSTSDSDDAPAEPVEESDSSSSEPAGEEPDSTPPADETSEETVPADEASEDEGAEEAPPAEEAKAEDEAPAEEPEAEAAAAEEAKPEEAPEEAGEAPAGDEGSDDTTSNDDTSEEEE
ncbi:MAG TPA: 50S ribosomal protein L10 [Solirubrobacterales bacterium]|jgi:large subunit ribosomal protein L10